ncbi:hypothetical protein CEXT_138691 [Caerostris extrusa]|uniref:Uncharacterized protein n=1 Tax=Caerostris extrusa TaxID=172846 RepID=A0AAV4MUF7_CAEEX|nr:hypothetical protein CEXT_138691 [Caerostris extrusa]
MRDQILKFEKVDVVPSSVGAEYINYYMNYDTAVTVLDLIYVAKKKYKVRQTLSGNIIKPILLLAQMLKVYVK